MSKPKVAKHWPSGSAAKTSSMYFGYCHPIDLRPTYDIVLNRLLQLTQDGAVQLLYVDNQIEERKVVAFRFTSDAAYNEHRDQLVKMASDLDRGIWEPNRNDDQRQTWLGEFADATPTIRF